MKSVMNLHKKVYPLVEKNKTKFLPLYFILLQIIISKIRLILKLVLNGKRAKNNNLEVLN